MGSDKVEVRCPKAILLGDSFTKGAGGLRYGGSVSYAGQAASLKARPSAVGVTGIVNDYGWLDGRKKFRDRVFEDVIAFDPNVVVIAGGTNNSLQVADGTVTPSQYRAEYDLLIEAIETGLPAAKIVALGPFLPRIVFRLSRRHADTRPQPGGRASCRGTLHRRLLLHGRRQVWLYGHRQLPPERRWARIAWL